jgi:stage III sporulation protein AH
MTMGKRQLVLAALVVALGAAVYLNFVFNGNDNQLSATQAVASNVDRQYGQELFVNGSAVSGKTAVSSVNSGKTASASAVSGQTTSAVKTAASATDGSFDFSEARLSRQKAQDQAKEEIEKVLTGSASTTAEAQKEAVAQAAALTQNIVKQADLETLIKAKGFSDCIVTLGNNQCSVIVKTKQNSENDAVVIQDIVSDQTGLPFDKIKIIERT